MACDARTGSPTSAARFWASRSMTYRAAVRGEREVDRVAGERDGAIRELDPADEPVRREVHVEAVPGAGAAVPAQGDHLAVLGEGGEAPVVGELREGRDDPAGSPVEQ